MKEMHQLQREGLALMTAKLTLIRNTPRPSVKLEMGMETESHFLLLGW